MNGHFGTVGDDPSKESFEHGIQVIDEEKVFNPALPAYLSQENITRSGFNYHLISVFGSQSTGKSTLLNALFGTQFGVMSEQERKNTIKNTANMLKFVRYPDIQVCSQGRRMS